MKKFKTKILKRRYYFIALIFVIIFFVIFFIICSFKLEKSYASFIQCIYKDLGITKEKKINPINYLMGNLDYLISDYLFLEEEILATTISYPTIYIYNTHDTEMYKENNDYNIKATVITASYMLRDALSKYKIEAFVEEKRVSDNLNNKNYNESYKISRTFLEKTVLENNQYNYFIDIHRDSVGEQHTQIEINGKEYARIMFVLGLENENFLQNKYLMEKINDYLNEHYVGLSRGIYEKSGVGVNGVYNQDFHPNTILIEIGGVDSNLTSVFNSTEIIAEALYYIIGDQGEKVY